MPQLFDNTKQALLKILIIEDNKDILEIIEYLLGDEGYDVISCSDGTSIENLRNINPDLILMDELLPTMRGSELCSQIKASEDFKNIPVVIISAMQSLDSIAKKCGADAFVEKPFNINALTEIVKELLAKKQ